MLDAPHAPTFLAPRVAPAAETARFILRARPGVGAALGVALPDQACRAQTRGDCAALWLGPDEWLLLAPPGTDAPVLDANVPHAIVDVSHRQLGLTIFGAGAETLLSTGCPLDLAVSAFPVGMCTRTIYAKAEIVLWRRDAQVFHVEVARSFVAYLTRHLEQACADWFTQP